MLLSLLIENLRAVSDRNLLKAFGFALHRALKITVSLELFDKVVVLKIALQAGTQVTEAQNSSSLIHLLFEGREKPHFPHSELRDFFQINDDPDTFLGEPPMEKIFHA